MVKVKSQNNVKRQHYVPQFILRNFSRSDGVEKIDLCNLSLGNVFRKQNIPDHCQKTYFYGEDQVVENHLGLLENHLSLVIATVIEKEKISRDNAYWLNFFLNVQGERTLGRKHKMDDFGDALMKTMVSDKLKEQGLPEEVLDKVRLTRSNGLVENVRMGMITSVCTLDLKQFLLVNKTDKEFIIADDPLVRASLFLQKEYNDYTDLDF